MLYLREIRLRESPGRSSYLSGIPAVGFLGRAERLAFEKPVTFFVGENGTGKSTLLEAIAVAAGFNAEGGSRDHAFSTRETHSELCDLLTTVRQGRPKDGFFLRAESFYNVATYLDDNSALGRYGGRSFHRQSHGEALLAMVTNRFEGNGLYLMDEPESALSPQRLLSLLLEIDRLVKSDSQLIIATHSPILMAYPDAEILQFSDSGIGRVPYRETEHYRITKEFLEDPDRMLYYLLNEEG